ncbi:hypothetical protein J4526_06720 [Desulfurococcaceae archaeon MEX13E-LK6-19]|nr:hypothetical protein J4526_06720 [Desulfurococcaceae archaeon MEX13E-LK6-19]
MAALNTGALIILSLIASSLIGGLAYAVSSGYIQSTNINIPGLMQAEDHTSGATMHRNCHGEHAEEHAKTKDHCGECLQIHEREHEHQWVHDEAEHEVIQVEGIVVETNPEEGYIVVNAANTTYTVRIKGMWLDESTNTTVWYTEIIKSIETGSQIVVTGYACEHNNGIGAQSIIIGGSEYVKPHMG